MAGEVICGAVVRRDDDYDPTHTLCNHSLRAAVLGKAHALMTDFEWIDGHFCIIVFLIIDT